MKKITNNNFSEESVRLAEWWHSSIMDLASAAVLSSGCPWLRVPAVILPFLVPAIFRPEKQSDLKHFFSITVLHFVTMQELCWHEGGTV